LLDLTRITKTFVFLKGEKGHFSRGKEQHSLKYVHPCFLSLDFSKCYLFFCLIECPTGGGGGGGGGDGCFKCGKKDLLTFFKCLLLISKF
jgi:hypothetical protein